uniref:Solute carrier family 22 member 5 n=1 Tax=Cajanus cajan TaxID=3821 RepID=A0A151RA38_CAJCA|nr:Solute carrier family 22 member 5 [Cajanus cajan]
MEESVAILTDSDSVVQEKLVLSSDEVIENGLRRFGWSEMVQCILVSSAMYFDAQQSFIAIYSDDYPTWHCTDPTTSFITGLPQSSFFMGCLVGSFLLATLADTSLGRKNLLVLSSLSMSISSVIIVFSTNVWVYSAFKFLIGFWRSSIGTCVLVLLTEKVSTEWRFTVGILEYFCFTLGRWALKRMLAIMVLGVGIGMVYFGMPLAVGNLGFDIYLAVVFNALMEIPSCVATYFLENYRRKPSILAFSVASGICCILCVVVGRGLQVAKVGLSLVAFFCNVTAYNVFLIYIIELFPTSVRNTTTSLVRQATVFGSIFSPFFIAAGRKNDVFSYGVFGVVIMSSCLTLVCLPETIGVALCDTMDQQEKKDTISA